MRLTLSLFVCLISLSVPSLAQTRPANQTTSDWLNTASGSLAQLPSSVPSADRYRKQLLGTPYEDSTFQTGTIRFYGKIPGTRTDSLGNIPLRYDLMAQQLELLAGPNNIRLAQAPQVREFRQHNADTIAHYVNVREFRGEAEPLSGFFEVLTKGRATLLRYPSVSINKSNYNVAMNTGNKDDEILLKQRWYAAMGPTAVAFTPTRRGLLSLFADKEADMDTYLKKQKPDLKSRAGLIAIFAYYNAL